MSREVARLLQEQLRSPLPTDLKLRFKELEVCLYKKQIEALEALVLAWVANGDVVAGAHRLNLLGEKVLEMRKLREQNVQEIKRRRKEQEAFPAKRSQRMEGPFAALVKPTSAEIIPRQLEEPERRRANLLAELSTRPRGTKTKLAAALGCSRAYLSQMLSEPSSVGHRSINSEVARTLEAALKLKAGALDRIELRSDTAALQQASLELAMAVRKAARKKPRRSVSGPVKIEE